MKLETYGHACLKVTENGTGLITDPWLVGSCYWRSWWHFPAVEAPFEEIAAGVQFIYLTHEHWDHLHYPSMRKFSRDVTVLVAKAPIPRMKENVEMLGFHRVLELPHGKPFRLSPGLEITSYQFSEVNDTALVITNGRRTILNLNDCDIRGVALRQIQKRHPRIDFLLMSHSNAAGYPYCYQAEDPDEAALRDRTDYIEEFCYMGYLLRPRYAIPFASNHCYLHRDTLHFNDYVVSPLDVQHRYAFYRIPGSECVVMTSGDSWDEAEGFRIGNHRPLYDRKGAIELYRARHAEALEAYYAEESRALASFDSFARYFKRHMRMIPWLLRKVFPGVYVFEVPSDPKPFWVADFGRGEVYQTEKEPTSYHLKYQIPPAVLKDCSRKDMWPAFGPGKRYRALIKKGALRYRFFLFVSFDLVANGFLPLKNNLKPRALRVLFARRRELYVYLGTAWKLLFWRGVGNRLRALYPKRLDSIREEITK